MTHDIFSEFSSQELKSAINNKLFRGMLDTMSIAVAVLEAVFNRHKVVDKFVYTFANQTAEKMAEDSLSGTTLYLNDDATLFSIMADVVATGIRRDFVSHYQRTPEKWLRYSIIKFDSGVLLTYENITGRKKTELLLEHYKQWLDNAQEISHTGSFEWDFINDKTYWADETYRIFGLEPQAEPMTRIVFKFSAPG